MIALQTMSSHLMHGSLNVEPQRSGAVEALREAIDLPRSNGMVGPEAGCCFQALMDNNNH